MKVTVCFGDVRVLVPCGQGDLLVRDLIREATLRYKKATGKGPESWVAVRNMRSGSGGILDPDDRLRDVADDRETLAASLEPHAGADGASGSSVGTASPDMFRGGGGGVGGSMRVGMRGAEACGVEVGAADLEDAGGGLQVRRGSEPTLCQDALTHSQPQLPDHTKRWSAAVVCREDVRVGPIQKIHQVPDGRSLDPHPSIDSNRLHPSSGQHFQRQSNRLSMQFSGPGSGVWIDAAERIQSCSTKSLPRDSARKEPLGQDTSVSNNTNHRVEDMLKWVSGVNNNVQTSSQSIQERPLDYLPEVNGSASMNVTGLEVPVSAGAGLGSIGRGSMSVALVKGEKGLGFTITTRDNPTGGVCPIYIKNILPKGAAVMDGRLRAGDRLVSVNSVSVSGLSQQQVVALLRNTPTNSTVTIAVERPGGPGSGGARAQHVEPQVSPSKYNEKAIGSPNSISSLNTHSNKLSPAEENGRVSCIVNAINQNHNSSMRGRIKKSSSKDDLINRDNNSSDHTLQDALNSSNTVLGLRNRLVLRLDVPVHDSEKAGLGISVKGKVTVGPHPQDLGIFIKSVLNGGAASRDGRLHTNDQLLNVNGVSLVGQSNAEAMETLRRALVHTRSNVQGNISLTIARRTESMDSLARWKDDTPPSINESSTNSSNDNSNSQTFSPTNNTVIYNSNANHIKQADHKLMNHKSIIHLDSNYNLSKSPSQHFDSNLNNKTESNSNNSHKKHSSIVNINNNNSWVSNQSDDSKGYLDKDSENNVSETDNKRDSFEWSRLDGWNPVIDRLTGLRNESYYMATQQNESTQHVNGHRDMPLRMMPSSMMGGAHMHHVQRSPPPHHNVIIEEDYGTTKPSTPNTPGVWESGSESGTGEGNAFSRDAVGRRSMSEKRHAAMDAKSTGTYKKLKEQKNANNAVSVGPSLGMRKSSSLESLQTAMQEVSMHSKRANHHVGRHNDPIYARAHQPLKHWLTDDNGPDAMIRGSPQQSSLSHKKPSLLKSLSTMLRFGKPRTKIPDTTSEIYGRSHPGRSSEKSLSKEALERINPPKHHSEERSHNEHSGHQHQRQASGEQLGEVENGHGQQNRSGRQQWAAPPYRLPPARTSPSSHPMSQVMEGAWGGGHYVNYEEIQQNLNARREKLSEVQIGQMRRQVHAQRIKAEEESRRAGLGGAPGPPTGYHSQRAASREPLRPQSNYYEYESIQHARPINTKVAPYH